MIICNIVPNVRERYEWFAYILHKLLQNKGNWKYLTKGGSRMGCGRGIGEADSHVGRVVDLSQIKNK